MFGVIGTKRSLSTVAKNVFVQKPVKHPKTCANMAIKKKRGKTMKREKTTKKTHLYNKT
jgi:hypothetical protein